MALPPICGKSATAGANNIGSTDLSPVHFGQQHLISQLIPPAEEHGANMVRELNRRELPSLRCRVLSYPTNTHRFFDKSPRSAPFEHDDGRHRSPREIDADKSPQGHSPRTNSDNNVSAQGSYRDTGMGGCSSLKRLRIGNSCSAGGQRRKRPASSRSTTDGALTSHAYRKDTWGKGSCAPPMDLSNLSPFATSVSLCSSPTSSASTGATGHGNNSSGTPLRRGANQLQDTSTGMQPFWPNKKLAPRICEYRSRRPRNFETDEEFKVHTTEKQFSCQYCGNRFGSNNEAKRHEKSVHVRRFSWSCMALSTFQEAFNESTARPGEADTCGYCGKDFLRSGGQPTSKVATRDDWDERLCHLEDTHKFSQCNGKEFYRADHFRQHLQHIHAGVSGEWSGLLDDACMTETAGGSGA